MAGGDDDDIRTQKTHRGFANPLDPGVPAPKRGELGPGEFSGFSGPPSSPVSSGHLPPASPPSLTESGELYLPPGTTEKNNAHDRTPLVEIEVMHQHGPSPHMDRPSHVVEVWTLNRVYTMDASMTCVSVTDRASSQPNPGHGFVGCRLVGGQHRDGETFELSYPYPRPGTEAVFEHPGHARFSRTSPVQRVVLRLHVVTVAPSRLVPTWADITAHEVNEA
ncbi:MAG: hypothetical protein ACI9KE_001632 [Polyangiales bacterium]|jgi:hypothetical protein